jgi:hypothetical protein
MKSIKAVHGEKMIEIRIKFWTNNIASSKGDVIPKTCWDCGMIVMEKNSLHGIKPQTPLPFPTFSSISRVIEKVLVQHGIKMKHGSKSSKLLYDKWGQVEQTFAVREVKWRPKLDNL